MISFLRIGKRDPQGLSQQIFFKTLILPPTDASPVRVGSGTFSKNLIPPPYSNKLLLPDFLPLSLGCNLCAWRLFILSCKEWLSSYLYAGTVHHRTYCLFIHFITFYIYEIQLWKHCINSLFYNLKIRNIILQWIINDKSIWYFWLKCPS